MSRAFPLHLHTAYAGTPSTGAMMTDRCLGCGGAVELANEAGYQPVRINGDSANGYEPLCAGCWPEPCRGQAALVSDTRRRDLIHWTARCYPGRPYPPDQVTTDPFAVTCVKCQRSSAYKAAVAAAF